MNFDTSIAILIGLAVCFIIYIAIAFKNGETAKIYGMIKALVDEAEARFGAGTGELKYEFVVKQAYSAIPPILKIFVTEKLMNEWIETAVDELQEALNKKIEEAK